jgi:hypothetical protein
MGGYTPSLTGGDLTALLTYWSTIHCTVRTYTSTFEQEELL